MHSLSCLKIVIGKVNIELLNHWTLFNAKENLTSSSRSFTNMNKPFQTSSESFYEHSVCQWCEDHSAQCVLCQVRCHCIFYGPGIRYSSIFCVPCISSGYSDIFWHISVVDTVTYFGRNHGSRVWKSLKLKKCIFRALEQAGTNICSIG